VLRRFTDLPAPIFAAMVDLRAEILASFTIYTLDKIRQSLFLGPAGGVDLSEDTLNIIMEQVSHSSTQLSWSQLTCVSLWHVSSDRHPGW